jgi:hypothetical protein
MVYNSDFAQNFIPEYDELIHNSLIRVGKEHEYIVADTGEQDDAKIRSYRILFANAIRFVISSYAPSWLRTEVVLAQAAVLEAGWAFLPSDFLIFFNDKTQQGYQSSSMQIFKDGRKIFPFFAEMKIVYLRQPNIPGDLTPRSLEFIELRFLKTCTMLDQDWISKSQMINVEYAQAEAAYRHELSAITVPASLRSRSGHNSW